MNRTISETLAEWLAGLAFADLPGTVVDDARSRLLDTIAVALAACREPLAASAREAARAFGSGTEAHALGFGDHLPATAAAFLNGTLAHALDFDDTHPGSVMHASVVVVPAALAVAEQVDATGADLLLAVAAGNEIACRLGLGAPGGFHARGFHPTGVLGAVAAAFVAGRLRELPADRLVHAAGIAGSMGSGILEAYSDGTWSKTLHAGWAAHAGLVAASLAAAGFSGPASVIEGRFGVMRAHVPETSLDLDAVAAGLGRRWHGPAASFKPYPCAHAIHPFVDAILALRAEGLTAEAVTEMTFLVPAGHAPMIAEPLAAKLSPRTPTHARASLPYAVASALIHGDLGPARYGVEAIADPAVLRLAATSRIESDPSPGAPDAFHGGVTVRTRDGRAWSRTESANRGSPRRPFGRADFAAKLAAGVADVLPQDRAPRIMRLLDRLEQARARDLVALTLPDREDR